MEPKRIVFEQVDPSKPISISIEGMWRAKEISQIQRSLILAYRRTKNRIRKQEQKEE